MWFFFAVSVFAGILFLIIPGMLMLRCFSINAVTSIALGPILSVPYYVICAAVCNAIGVSCNWLSVGLIPILVTICAFIAIAIWRHNSKRKIEKPICGSLTKSCKRQRCGRALVMAIYAAVGIIATCVFFLINLEDPNNFMQAYDNVYHLARLDTYIESGKWSLTINSFYALSDNAAIPFENTASGFYPSGWHVIVALIVSLTSCTLGLGENACNCAFIIGVFMPGMFLFLEKILPKGRKLLSFSSVLCVAFLPFPWGFLTFGPIFPNLASMCAIPAILAIFIRIFDDARSAKSRVACLIFVVVACFTLYLLQPNGVFTCVAFLAFFLIFQAGKMGGRLKIGNLSIGVKRFLFGTICAVCILVIWTILFKLPMFQAVLSENWSKEVSPLRAIFDIAIGAYHYQYPQIALAILILLGVIYIIVFDRKRLWLVCSYLLLCAMFFLDTAVHDHFLKTFLTGFWYTDPYRTVANIIFAGVPLSTFGILCIAKIFSAMRCKHHATTLACCVSAALLLTMLIPLSFSTRYEGNNNVFSVVANDVQAAYNPDTVNIYTTEEQEFINKVNALLPENTLCLNDPNDGSAFAASLDDLSCYYRELRFYGESTSETATSVLIRTGLNQIATSSAVLSAVQKTGATYLLLLDSGEDPYGNRTYLWTHDDYDWSGIEQVTPDTPGFELVLNEGDMYLYKITAVA